MFAVVPKVAVTCKNRTPANVSEPRWNDEGLLVRIQLGEQQEQVRGGFPTRETAPESFVPQLVPQLETESIRQSVHRRP